jgi:hypothetical protein
MENYCQGCSSSHQKMMNTWNKKGSLQPGDYNPFDSMGLKEGYCGNATLNTSWTRANNVTPDNSSLYHTYPLKFTPIPHKENFCSSGRNTYPRMNQTWIKQKPYTSN